MGKYTKKHPEKQKAAEILRRLLIASELIVPLIFSRKTKSPLSLLGMLTTSEKSVDATRLPKFRIPCFRRVFQRRCVHPFLC